MNNLPRVVLILIVVFSFSSCNDDDSPELGKISFTWTLNGDSPNIQYYAIVSDTTGGILGWGKLNNGVRLELNFVPVGQTGLVTIVYNNKDSHGNVIADMTTFTNVQGGDYSYSDPLFPSRQIGAGRYYLNLENVDDFASFSSLAKSGFASINRTEDGTLKYEIGLSDTEKEDLFVSMQKNYEEEYRYLYLDDIKDGGITTITPQNFGDLTLMPTISLDYPEHDEMISSSAAIFGRNEVTDVIVSTKILYADGDPTMQFIAPAGAFTQIGTYITGFDADGSTNEFRAVSDKPVTTIAFIHSSLVSHDLKTKRISANVTGDGQMIYVQGNFNSTPLSTSWAVSAPKSEKVRINLPVFTDDIIATVPAVSMPKDKLFTRFSIYDYDVTYDQYYKNRLSASGFWYYDGSTRFREKNYRVNLEGGRINADPAKALEAMKSKFDKTFPRKH